MVENSPRGPADRPLRDVGAFVVLLTARPVRWWHNRSERRDGLPLTTLADMRNQARRFPREGWEFVFINMARTLAWIFTGLVLLAATIATGLIRDWTGTRGHAVPETIMTVVGALTMFAFGAGMVSSLRWVLAHWKEDRLEEVLEPGPVQQSHDLLVRLCTPSNVDLVFALLWSMCISMQIFA